jgi:hypothetical protein
VGEAPVTPVYALDSSYLNLSYKPCDNILAPLPGNTESTFLNDISLVSLAYLATPLAFPPISLVVSGKLSGDSIDFSQRATLPSVIYSKLWDHGLLGTNVSNY